MKPTKQPPTGLPAGPHQAPLARPERPRNENNRNAISSSEPSQRASAKSSKGPESGRPGRRAGRSASAHCFRIHLPAPALPPRSLTITIREHEGRYIYCVELHIPDRRLDIYDPALITRVLTLFVPFIP